jgi:hypothetical protein
MQGNHMSLFDLMFPEQAQAMYLKDLRDQNKRSLSSKRTEESRISSSSSNEIKLLKNENEQLRNDMGVIALSLASLMRAIEKKGLLTNHEIKDMINEVDFLDSVKDGKLDINFLRDLVRHTGADNE